MDGCPSRPGGGYPTTEARVSEGYAPGEDRVSVQKGLRLVRDACDELEAQVSRLLRQEQSRPARTTTGAT